MLKKYADMYVVINKNTINEVAEVFYQNCQQSMPYMDLHDYLEVLSEFIDIDAPVNKVLEAIENKFKDKLGQTLFDLAKNNIIEMTVDGDGEARFYMTDEQIEKYDLD